MNIKIQFILDSNPLLKEHSFYYKNIIRNPDFINNITDFMKKDYKLTFPDKLSKIKDNITMVNSLMDVIK